MGKWELPKVNLELGEEGLKLVFDLFERREKLTDWVKGAPRRLRIDEDTRALAEMGLPECDSPEPSSKEQEIRAAHREKADETTQEAEKELIELRLRIQGNAPTSYEADVATLRATLQGNVEKIFSGLENALFKLMRAKELAEAKVRGFNLRNGTENQPLQKSFPQWLATAMVTAFAEALINGLLFKDKLALDRGIVFSFGVGAAIAAIGVALGIGLANIKRSGGASKLIGGGVAAAAGLASAYFLLGMGHYREALVHGNTAAEAAATGATTLWHSPFAPLASFPMLPFIVLNLAGLVLVTWKSIPMFGFMDLKRLRADADTARDAVVDRIDEAADAIDVGEAWAIDEAAETLSGIRSKLAKVRDHVTESELIVEVHSRDVETIWDSQITCEQRYREIVRQVHPAGEYQPRFDVPLPRAAPHRLTIDAACIAILRALEAREGDVEKGLSQLHEAVYAVTREARERLDQLITQVEADAKVNRSASGNVLRFRQAGGPA